MIFLALLTKELRSRMRKERTIWVLIIYILLMCVPGLLLISRISDYSSYSNDGFSALGNYLYILLSMIQLFLILFITPAYTSTTVNGEKERQTYDLLLCSQLTSLSLVGGKLVAGIVNALLLVAASIPLFSLVFFFGGVSPLQVLTAMLIYSVTALLSGTYGLFCSTVFSRPALSTAITYVSGIIWIIVSPISVYLWYIANLQSPPSFSTVILFLSWNPVMALVSSYPSGASMPGIALGSITIAAWQAYVLISLAATVLFFVLSLWTVKPSFTRHLLIGRGAS
jgi:ABC-type transport system involved in multi-copper enzyme maturation permease subunit